MNALGVLTVSIRDVIFPAALLAEKINGNGKSSALLPVGNFCCQCATPGPSPPRHSQAPLLFAGGRIVEPGCGPVHGAAGCARGGLGAEERGEAVLSAHRAGPDAARALRAGIGHADGRARPTKLRQVREVTSLVRWFVQWETLILACLQLTKTIFLTAQQNACHQRFPPNSAGICFGGD